MPNRSGEMVRSYTTYCLGIAFNSKGRWCGRSRTVVVASVGAATAELKRLGWFKHEGFWRCDNADPNDEGLHIKGQSRRSRTSLGLFRPKPRPRN